MGEKDKIKQYLDYKGISKNRFYSMTGLSIGFLDSGTSMGADKVKIIINKFPDISIDWLILDRVDMILSPEKAPVDSSIIDELLRTKDELIDLQKKHITLLEEKLRNK